MLEASKKIVFFLVIFLLMFSAVDAQKKSKKEQLQGKPVLWERVNVRQQNLFLGPGGNEMRPDLSNITFLRDERGGASRKYRIKDGSGRTWVAKVGREAQSEVAANRFLWALGYKSEIDYNVPKLTIPGKGTFTNVRLEARPPEIERTDERWHWKNNPFLDTHELQGLKIMMALMNNWDIKGDGNNKILIANKKSGKEVYYIVSDMGATFGRHGYFNFPFFWRLGRNISNPGDYSKSQLVKGVKNGRIKISYVGRIPGIFNNITVENGRWITNLLKQLSDKQIEDAFRAANYSPTEVRTYSIAVRNRISELDRATNQLRARSQE